MTSIQCIHLPQPPPESIIHVVKGIIMFLIVVLDIIIIIDVVVIIIPIIGSIVIRSIVVRIIIRLVVTCIVYINLLFLPRIISLIGIVITTLVTVRCNVIIIVPT